MGFHLADEMGGAIKETLASNPNLERSSASSRSDLEPRHDESINRGTSRSDLEPRHDEIRSRHDESSNDGSSAMRPPARASAVEGTLELAGSSSAAEAAAIATLLLP